jgi:RNA polymerase sigma-70 factor (ECF subfamily)
VLLENLRAARPDLVVADPAAIEARLVALLESTARPDLPLEGARFVRWLAEHLPEGDAATGLERVVAGDLWLTCACADGVPGALEAFERELGGELDRALRHRSGQGVDRDDLGQLVRQKLFVGEGPRGPRIADYSGRGPLRVWLRVVVGRLLSNLHRDAPPERALGSALAERLGATADPELALLRMRYAAEVRAAFAEAAAALPLRDRLLLHERFAGACSLDELAARYGVHINTMTRWLVRARAALERGIRGALAQRLQVDEVELSSCLRLVGSQLDVTLGRLAE